jgi:hypothetical protein
MISEQIAQIVDEASVLLMMTRLGAKLGSNGKRSPSVYLRLSCRALVLGMTSIPTFEFIPTIGWECDRAASRAQCSA